MIQVLLPLGWAHCLAGGVLNGCDVALLDLYTGREGGMSTVASASWF